MINKIKNFASLVEAQQTQRLVASGLNCAANMANVKTSVIPGKKYAKVDIGTSGRFMVEMETGNIFGIKGYGQIHKGHFYGTVDTTADYFWGEYYPQRISTPLPTQTRSGAPVLTFAPKLETTSV